MIRGKARLLVANLILCLSLTPLLLTACVLTDVEQAPQRQDVALISNPSFTRDIKPILNEYCVKCHEPRDAHMELQLDTYEAIMKGDREGPVIIPGQPKQSMLLKVIKREAPPPSWMPFHQEPLTPNRIQNIENWIIQGAPNN